MKNLKSIFAILAIVLMTSLNANANEIKPIKASSKLRAEVVNYLGKQLPFQLDRNSTAEVSFMINNEGKLVVVAVDSEIFGFGSYVKSKINYKKIKTTGVSKGILYKVPFQIQTKS